MTSGGATKPMGILERLASAAPLCGALAFLAAFVVVPVAAMFLSTVWVDGGLSFASFREILATEADRVQLLRTLALGLVGTAIAVLAGAGHVWLCLRTDMPAGSWLLPLGIAPLVLPPILVAMGFADFTDVRGFFACAALLGVSYAPFVAVLTARGLRSIDGRLYESALMARGPLHAEGLLLRMVAPELVAGALLAFVFVIGEHGVPEFLTVKGKTWHTYAEGVFGRWTRRNVGLDPLAVNAPIVAAVPLVALVALGLAVALKLRARATLTGDPQPLPIRRLGSLRWPALALPTAWLCAGVVAPVVVMTLWAFGSTQLNEPMAVTTFVKSLRNALAQAGSDLWQTTGIAIATTGLLTVVAIPLARRAARGSRWIEPLAVLSIAVPAVLLAIGQVRIFNREVFGSFYDSSAMVVCAYGARLLPFAVLTLAQWARRVPPELGEAALLSGRGPLARAWYVELPPLLPAIGAAACLVFVLALRELDTAVVLPAGNGTVVRRLSNVVHFGGEDVGGALALLLLGIAVLVPGLVVLLTGKRLRSLS